MTFQGTYSVICGGIFFKSTRPNTGGNIHEMCVQSTAVSAIVRQSRSAFTALLVEPIFPQEAKWLSCGLTLFVSAYAVCVCVCVWVRKDTKQESVCVCTLHTQILVYVRLNVCIQAFLGDYMIELQDQHAFLRSAWGLPVSWNIPLIPHSRKCFMTAGTDITPLRPICKV